MSIIATRARSASWCEALARAILLLSVGACGGGGEGGPSGATPPATPTLTLSAPSSLSVQQGQSGSLTVSRGGTFTGELALTVSGAPAGTTVAPATMAAGAQSSTLTVVTTAATAPGTSTLTITGSAIGLPAITRTVALTVTAPPSPPQGFTVAVTPNPVVLTAGGTATATVTLVRTGGFAGEIALTVSGMPAGVTAAVSSTPTTGSTATVTFTAPATQTAGVATITVSATAAGLPGQPAQSATTTLNVSASPVTGGYSLSVAPSPIPVVQGQTTTGTVSITRTGGFTGPVTLAVGGLPAGVTATVAPNPVTSGTATLTLTATATAATGAGTLIVTGTAAGLPIQTATAAVAVSTPTTGGASGTGLNFCSSLGVTTFVAAQDGTGPWRRVLPSADGSYRVSFASGRGGVAYVIANQEFSGATVYYLSAAELQNSFSADGCISTTEAGGGRLVNGSVAALGAGEVVNISAGPASALVGSLVAVPGAPAPATSFQLRLPDTPVDLVAGRSAPATVGGPFTLNSVILRRGINPAAGSTLPPLDFASEGFAPVSTPLAVGNLGSDAATVQTLVITSRGTPALLGVASPTGRAPGVAPSAFPAIPANRLAAGDVQGLQVSAFDPSTPSNSRSVVQYFTTPGARTVTLGPALATPTFTAGTFPRLRVPVQPEYAGQWIATFISDVASARPRFVFVRAGVGYFGGTAPATVDLSVPDLSGVEGWNPAWTFGVPQGYSLFAFGNEIRSGTLDGLTVRAASRSAFSGFVSAADVAALERQGWTRAAQPHAGVRR